MLAYLIQEGFDRDGLSLLLQHNAKRVLGIYQRAGHQFSRDKTEPELATPCCFFVEELQCLCSLALEIPTGISPMYLLIFDENVYRNPRPWARPPPTRPDAYQGRRKRRQANQSANNMLV